MSPLDMVTDRVVVGVDGSRTSRHAVLWAAGEARIRHSDLIIVHVDPSTTGAAHLTEPFLSVGGLLEASAAAASQREPPVTVATLLIRGHTVEQLALLSKSASLLVLGVDRAKPRSSRGEISSLADSVIVHAGCPVVTVSIPARIDHRVSGQIVVGWTPSRTSRLALETAAAEAELRNAALVVAVVSARRGGPSEATSARGDPGASVGESLAKLKQAHPDVDVSVGHQDSDIIPALVRQSQHADLLVIGCHHASSRWTIRTGAVATTIIRQALCPVMLVGQPAPGARQAASPAEARRRAGRRSRAAVR